MSLESAQAGAVDDLGVPVLVIADAGSVAAVGERARQHPSLQFIRDHAAAETSIWGLPSSTLSSLPAMEPHENVLIKLSTVNLLRVAHEEPQRNSLTRTVERDELEANVKSTLRSEETMGTAARLSRREPVSTLAGARKHQGETMIRRFDRRVMCTIVGACLLVAAVPACGSDDGKTAATTTTAATATTDATATTAATATNVKVDPLAPKPLASPRTLAVAAIQTEGWATLYVANAMGEFAKENLTLKIDNLPQADGFALLVAGKVDLQLGSANAGFFNAVSQGLNAKVVAGAMRASPTLTTGIWVSNKALGDATAKNFDPKKIKTFGVQASIGGIGDFTLWSWLQETGGNFNAVAHSVLPTGPDLVLALEQGTIDAAFIGAPFNETLAAGGKATWVRPTPLDLHSGSMIMAGAVIDKEPLVAEAFLRALIRTSRTYMQGNYYTPEIVKILSAATGAKPESFKTPSISDPDQKINPPSYWDQYQVFLKAVDLRKYDTPLPASKVSDPTIAERVLKGT